MRRRNVPPALMVLFGFSVLLAAGCATQAPVEDEAAARGLPPLALHSSAGVVSASCGGGTCRVTVDGQEVAEFMSHGRAADVIAPLNAFSGVTRDMFLIHEEHGDGCPSMIRVLCTSQGVRITEPFGNCEAPDSLSAPTNLIIEFPRVRYSLDGAQEVRRDFQKWEINSSCRLVRLE